jgi:hypothetical protein
MAQPTMPSGDLSIPIVQSVHQICTYTHHDNASAYYDASSSPGWGEINCRNDWRTRISYMLGPVMLVSTIVGTVRLFANVAPAGISPNNIRLLL